MDLVEQGENRKKEAIENRVMSIFGPDVDNTKVKDHVKYICLQFQSRWSKSHRDKARFMHDNAIWLSSKISAVDFAHHAPSTSKLLCYPSILSVTETYAEINLHSCIYWNKEVD